MNVKDQHLKPMLDAGSSRVFNCNDRMRKLIEDQIPSPYFFKVPKMHGLVLIKEAIHSGLRRNPDAPIVGTKLYFPYNHADVYEGGRSVFYHERGLDQVLRELLGLNGDLSEADLQHDMKMLRILDGLPSLDGFLMRDQLEIEGFSANENYFEVSDGERAAIHDFVRRRFEPLVRAACGSGASVGTQVTQLIDKIWEAKDKSALDPLIRAFRFPEEEALSIFASWKGINFYTFEYQRTRQQREQFGLWLRDKARSRNFLPKTDTERLEALRRGTIERLRRHWNAVEETVREYDTLYGRFLKTPDGVGDFVKFLRRSREIYWRMGDSLSKINHAIQCWTTMAAPFHDRILPADRLSALFDVLMLVLGGEEAVETAVVWQ